MNVDVFISHHTDSSKYIVKAIANKLESVGIRCWYSGRDIIGGSYADIIMQAIASCKIFLLVLNREASESPHVRNELEAITNRLVSKENVTILSFRMEDSDIAMGALYYTQRFHWIDALDPPMYMRIEELADRVEKLLGREENKSGQENVVTPRYRLISRAPQPKEIFLGRDVLLDEISQIFSFGQHVVFLQGIGGIGKSELAKQYAVRNREDYDQIVFLDYFGGLQQMLCATEGLEIEGIERRAEEKDADFFARKLKVLNKVASERTLLIVDNFDVDDDPDLKVFLQGNYRVIFTTRNTHSGYPTIYVDAIEDMDVLMQIFSKNYGSTLSPEERPVLEEIFQLIGCHTYTIELLAKQMEASFLSAEEMLNLLREGNLNENISETVTGRLHQRTAFDHILALFNIDHMSDQEKQLMMYLSLSGTGGVPARRFKEWAQLPDFKAVNQLINRSWLRRENGQRLSMHPLVRSVVHHVLKPTVENCRAYLYQMCLYCYRAWFRSYSENITVADTVQSVLEYFTELPGTDYLYFSCYANFLWQVGRFNVSIFQMHRVYDACVRDLGVNTMTTGFVAKALGACYFNSRRKQESIYWYKKGLESMQRSGEEENEDLAMSYEKVARCYTWEYEQDFAKAEELFRISLEIRERLLDKIFKGIIPPRQEEYDPYDINLAYTRIAEVHMEMGRMYQAMGNYEKGSQYALRYVELVKQYCPDDISGVAYGHYDCGVCQYHMGIALQKEGDEVSAAEQLTLAVMNLKKALDSNMKMRGALAIDTIDNQEYLADVYVAQGRYGEAANHYMAVLGMVEKLLGESHPRINQVKEKMIF